VIHGDHGAACADLVARQMSRRRTATVAGAVSSRPGSAAGEAAAGHLAGADPRLGARADRDAADGPRRWARHANVSPRTFARRFRAETGTTPLQWLLARRVLAARRLLERSDLPVETVALEAGFGDAASLRAHFRRATATTPTPTAAPSRRPI